MKTKKKLILLYLGLSLVILVSLALILQGLFKRDPFVRPAFDDQALEGEPSDAPPAYSVQAIEGVYWVGLNPELVLEASQVNLFLTSPPDNEIWLKARLYDIRGKLLGETGLIRPGFYVEKLTLAADTLQDGSPVVIKVMAYEAESFYSAGSFSLQTTVKKP